MPLNAFVCRDDSGNYLTSGNISDDRRTPVLIHASMFVDLETAKNAGRVHKMFVYELVPTLAAVPLS